MRLRRRRSSSTLVFQVDRMSPLGVVVAASLRKAKDKGDTQTLLS